MKTNFAKLLEYYGFVDIVYNECGFCATLPPYSNIRPFKKEKLRFFGIYSLQPKLIFSVFDVMEPISIGCERVEEIEK